jgi:hypothetical protein
MPGGAPCVRRPPIGGVEVSAPMPRSLVGRLAEGRDHARPPSQGPSPSRRTDRVGRQAAAGQQPGNHRVRVPHFPCPKLVPTPDRAGQAADQVQQPTRGGGVVAQQLRAGHGLAGVGDDPVGPAAHLIAEHAKPGQPPAGHRALDGHASRPAVGVRDRPAVLNDEASLRQMDDERGVVEIERLPPLQARVDGLVDAPVQPDKPAASPQRKPVQLDARLRHRGVPGLGDAGRRGPVDNRHDRPTGLGDELVAGPGGELFLVARSPLLAPRPDDDVDRAHNQDQHADGQDDQGCHGDLAVSTTASWATATQSIPLGAPSL